MVPGFQCREADRDFGWYDSILYLAAFKNLTLNSAYLARSDPTRESEVCQKILGDIAAGTLVDRLLYFHDPGFSATCRWRIFPM